MEYIVWLDQQIQNSLQLLGGKGAHLTEMVQLKLPVPPGFAITTKAFDRFIEATNIKETIQKLIDECNIDDTQQLLDTSKKIKELITTQDIPLPIKSEIIETYRSLSYSDKIINEKALKLISAGRELALVAIRSSATTEDLLMVSFAGQQATFLNVKGLKSLVDSVKKCWASLYEPRAIFYRTKHGFTHSSISVIVQKMVNSEKSGVMFTVNPTTGDDTIMIEATWGLGETLVSGEIQPDQYIVSKSGDILENKIGTKNVMKIRDYASDTTVEIPVAKNKVNAQVLTEDEMLKLVRYGLQLEEHYQKPQDVEFAIEKNRVYIVQTRAITTEAKKGETEVRGNVILKGLGSSPGVATGVVKIINSLEDLAKIQQGDIMVTKMTSPDMVVSMSKSVAIITDEGGVTAHASIVSREMGIPAIVGTQNATRVLQDGQTVTVDAYRGLVYSGETEVEKPKEIIEVPEGETATKIKVNLVFSDNAEEIAKKTDGVGLLRIEHMIVKSGIHPAKLIRENRAEEYIQILMDGIRPIAQAFGDKPVWVRTLDARSDEFRNLLGGEEELVEDNPMLGWHGIRRSLDEPDILKAEFEAVKRLHENGLTNVHIMLPFVISVDEFRRARDISKEVSLPDTVKMGIMVEVASAALIIDDFCKEGIDFASIGSNDLIQSVLGIDRNNAKISQLYDPYHPAVLKLIRHVIKTCKSYGVEISICGEAGSEERMAEILVENGINSISVNIDAVDKIKSVVYNTERKLLKESLSEVETSDEF